MHRSTRMKMVATLMASTVAWAIAWLLTFKLGWRYHDPLDITLGVFDASESFTMFCILGVVALSIVVVPIFMLADATKKQPGETAYR